MEKDTQKGKLDRQRKAVAYYRTSSAANIGEDKDSEKRQREACQRYATGQDLTIVKAFYDQAVQGGADQLNREGFAALMDYCTDNGIEIILCENASRFSRDHWVQERGYNDLKAAGLTLIPATTPDLFADDKDNPERKLIRQILGVLVEYEKDSIVLKLKGARQRKRDRNKAKGIVTLSGSGKCEGRKSLKEKQVTVNGKELVTEAKKLYRKPRNGDRLSRLEVSRRLFELGFTTSKGKPFSSSQMKRILE